MLLFALDVVIGLLHNTVMARLAPVYLIFSIRALEAKQFSQFILAMLSELSNNPVLEKIPIHWQFPVAALKQPKSTRVDRSVPMLRGRIASGSDMLMPLGFSGAPHSLLLAEDIWTELHWALRNPWKCGLENIFDKNPVALFPDRPDWLRESARSVYENYRGLLILPFFPQNQHPPFCLVREGPSKTGILGLITIDVTSITAGLQLPKKRSSLYRDGCILQVEFSHLTQTEKIKSQLDSLTALLETNPALDYFSMNGALNGNSWDWTTFEGETGSPPFNIIPEKQALQSQGAYKRSEINISANNLRKNRYQFRELGTISGTFKRLISIGNLRSAAVEPAGFSEKKKSPPGYEPISDMTGTITLEEETVKAHFSEGSLVGLSHGEHSVLTGLPGASYLQWEDQRRSYTPIGAFSFEQEQIRGLRVQLTFDGDVADNSGAGVIDYFFISDCPFLFISAYFDWPDVTPHTGVIRRYAPLEIPLYRLTELHPLTVTGRYPDGERYRAVPETGHGASDLPGSVFLFRERSEELLLAFPEFKSTPVTILPVEIRKMKKNSILYANPYGCYSPILSKALKGYSIHFNMLLGCGRDVERDYLSIGSLPLENFTPPWVFKDSSKSARPK